MALKKLNKRHEHFINHYVVTKNTTESAKIAGYGEHMAHSQGCKLLKDPLVKAKIDEQLQKIQAQYDLTQECIKHELGKIAMGERPADGTNVRALELMAKIKGMLIDKVEHTEKHDLVDKILTEEDDPPVTKIG